MDKQVEEAKREDGEYVNSRLLSLEALVTTISTGNYRVMREEVIHHMAAINR